MQESKPYVILISADGIRCDYAEKYNATHLLKLADDGVKAYILGLRYTEKIDGTSNWADEILKKT